MSALFSLSAVAVGACVTTPRRTVAWSGVATRACPTTLIASACTGVVGCPALLRLGRGQNHHQQSEKASTPASKATAGSHLRFILINMDVSPFTKRE